MIDRSYVPVACALLLLGIVAGCTSDGQSVAITAPAAVSVEPLDFAALNGKTIIVEGKRSGDAIDRPETRIMLPVIGKTIVWKYLHTSRCALKDRLYGQNLAILYTLDQPRAGVKVPCEGGRTFNEFSNSYDVTAPADVSYSSTMSVQGNVLELSGELTEHNSVTHEGGSYGPSTADIKQQQHVKVRISGDKCQVLEFAWTFESREVVVGQSKLIKQSVRATGCSIVAGHPIGY